MLVSWLVWWCLRRRATLITALGFLTGRKNRRRTSTILCPRRRRSECLDRVNAREVVFCLTIANASCMEICCSTLAKCETRILSTLRASAHTGDKHDHRLADCVIRDNAFSDACIEINQRRERVLCASLCTPLMYSFSLSSGRLPLRVKSPLARMLLYNQ